MSTQTEIIVREGTRPLGRYILDPGDYVIGKDLSCDILLDTAGISPRHTQVTVTPEGLLVRDLDSTNGTYLGENVVEGSTAVAWGNSIRLGSHGSAEFQLVKRKMPAGTNGKSKGKERKNGGAETAELQNALARVKAERDAAQKKQGDLADQHAQATHQIAAMQEELNRNLEAASTLTAERDEALARWSTTPRDEGVAALTSKCDDLQAALEKAEAAAAETAERQRQEIEAQSAEREAERRESDDAALSFAQLLSTVEAQVQSLTEERAKLAAETAHAVAELGSLVESQKSQIEAFSRERDRAMAEKDARLADAARVAAAHQREIEALTAQRESHVRENAEAVQRAAAAAASARQRAQSIEADRVLILEEKAAVTNEFEKIIEGHKRQIEALTQQHTFVIKERNEAYLRIDKLPEERQRDLEAHTTQRAALLRERDEAVARFTALGEENARQIEEITRQRDALAAERNKAMADHAESHQAMLRATEALDLEHRTTLKERDETAAGLQRIVDAQKQQIDALKADSLAASHDKDAQIEKLRAKHVATTAQSAEALAELRGSHAVQTQRTQLLDQQLTELAVEKDQAVAGLAAFVELQKKEIASLARERDDLVKAREAAVSQLTTASAAQAAQLAALSVQRDELGRERDAALARFVEATKARDERVAALVQERDALLAANDHPTALFAEVSDSLKQQIATLNGAAEVARQEHAAVVAQLKKVSGDQKAQIALLQKQRDEAAVKFDREREGRAREFTLMQQDRAALIEQREEKIKEWGLAELALKQEIAAVTLAAEAARQEHESALAQLEKVSGDQKAQNALLLKQRDEVAAKFDRERKESAREVAMLQQAKAALIEQRDKKMQEWGLATLALKEEIATVTRAAEGARREHESTLAQLEKVSGDRQAQILLLLKQRDEVAASFDGEREGHVREFTLAQQDKAALIEQRDEKIKEWGLAEQARKQEIAALHGAAEGARQEHAAVLAQLQKVSGDQQTQIALLLKQRDEAAAKLDHERERRSREFTSAQQEKTALIDKHDEKIKEWGLAELALKQEIEAITLAAEGARQEHESVLAQLKKVSDDEKAQIALLLKQRDEVAASFDQERDGHVREFALLQQDRTTLIEQRDEKVKEWGLAEQALKQEIAALHGAAEGARQEHAAVLAQHQKVSGDQKTQIALLLKQRDEAAATFEREREGRTRKFALLQQDRAALIEQHDEKIKAWGLAELALKQEIEAVTLAAEGSRQEHTAVLAQLEKVSGDQKTQIALLLKQRDEVAAKLDRERNESTRAVSVMQQEKAALVEQHDEKLKHGSLTEQALKQEIEGLARARDDAAKERDQARSDLAVATDAHQAQLAVLNEHRTALVQDRDGALARFAEINQAQVKQLDLLRKQREAGAKQKEITIAQLTQTTRAQKDQLASLIKERDSARREKAATVAELSRLNEAQGKQIEALESDRLGLRQQHEEAFAQLTAVNGTQREQLEALEEQRLLAIREKDEAFAQYAHVNGVQQKRIDELLHAQQIVERERDLGNEKLGRIHGEHRAETEALAQERDGLFAKLSGLRAECDSAHRERDETLSLVKRLKEHHRLDLSALAQEREALTEERDRAVVRLESFVGGAKGEDELAKARASHRAEIEEMLEHQKKLRVERDEAMGRLEHQKESQKLQLEKLAQERLDLVDQRDRLAVQVEAAHEEGKQAAHHFETTRENLIKERDKAFAVLNEAREVQKHFEETFAENSSLTRELGAVEQALRGLAGGQPAGQKGAAPVETILTGLKAKLAEARQKAEEVGRLNSFELSTAERLLNRHKYEFGTEISSDRSLVRIRAKDVNVDRVVEMKFIAAMAASREETIAQLIDEAQMIGRLEHPNIQPMYDLGVDETGRAFYTTKFLNGSSLAKILEDLHARKASALVHFDLKRLLTIVDSICDAIAFAHEQGVAHGNLTADAVQIGGFGEVLVTGWEKAKKVRRQNVADYEKDIRVDIAALGDLLYHILTLTAPVPDETKSARPDKQWKVPKGLWSLTLRIRADRAAATYPRVKQMQMEISDFRDELGPRGGRASAFDTVNQYLHKWE